MTRLRLTRYLTRSQSGAGGPRAEAGASRLKSEWWRGKAAPTASGTARELTLRDGRVLKMGPDEMVPFTIVQAEMFKIVDNDSL